MRISERLTAKYLFVLHFRLNVQGMHLIDVCFVRPRLIIPKERLKEVSLKKYYSDYDGNFQPPLCKFATTPLKVIELNAILATYL